MTLSMVLWYDGYNMAPGTVCRMGVQWLQYGSWYVLVWYSFSMVCFGMVQFSYSMLWYSTVLVWYVMVCLWFDIPWTTDWQ